MKAFYSRAHLTAKTPSGKETEDFPYVISHFSFVIRSSE